MPRRSMALLLTGLVACTPALDEAAHDDMPEAAAPIAQSVEDGPVAEGVLQGPLLARPLAVILPRPASRATVWLSLAGPEAEAPVVEARAGWANGRTAAWRPLELISAEGVERVLALDLETAATALDLRWSTSTDVVALRWAASVPLDPRLRQGALPNRPPLGAVTSRSGWGAAPARCGAEDRAAVSIVVRGALAADDEPAALRARQAFDRDGLGLCDLRPSYVVGEGGAYQARGERRAAAEPRAAANAGRRAVTVLGCAPSQQAQDNLHALLTAMVARHALTSPDQIAAAASPACAAPTGVQAALGAWLASDPFVEPPPPPPETGDIAGTVVEPSGQPVPGATVTCVGCGEATTDGAGAFAFTALLPGRYRLRAEAAGFTPGEAEVEVRASAAAEVRLTLAPEPPDRVSRIDHALLIERWGGVNADPAAFAATQVGFQEYLDAVGVTYFAAWEYVVPNNPRVAAGCGYEILLPERDRWPRAAALGLLADQLRALVDEPVTLRNWWRPPCYNEGVGGAPGGDHPDADALDLDFRSATSRAAAQRYLCESFWAQDLLRPEEVEPGVNPRLNLSVGLGGVTIHLGLLSDNGRRFWKYSSYTQQPNSGACW